MKAKNWFWGLFFIAAAAVILLSGLGYLENVSVWSLVVTILLIPVIIKSALHLNFGGIFFPLAVIGIIYAEPLGITGLVPWPVLLVATFATIGFSIIFGGPKFTCHHGWHNIEQAEGFEEIVNVPDGNRIDFSVNFGSSIKYVNSEALQRADLRASFGALKVYFDNAKIHEDGAQINLDVSFSGVELFFPKTWKVVSNLNVNLAGVDEKNRRDGNNGPLVTLTGNVSLGGVEIIYV